MKQVVAAIIIQDSKIPICQRKEDQAMPLKWEFPGGKVERDEDLKDALHRELDEELGIDAVIGRKIAAIQHTYANGASLALYFYRVDQFKNEIENRIFHDVRWVDRKELPTYDFLEADVRLIETSARANCFSRRPVICVQHQRDGQPDHDGAGGPGNHVLPA